MKRPIIRLLAFLFSLYILICTLVFFNQESLLFHPEKVNRKTLYQFDLPFREIDISVAKDCRLNGVLFPADFSKGLVFFLHGNAGNVSVLNGQAMFYHQLGYDFFAFDYRGFGKSDGEINSEEQFYSDAQAVYNQLKKRYAGKKIIIVGYSVGSATATRLAAQNRPDKLVLMAPYYSMTDLAGRHYPFIPSFVLKYSFETFRFLEKTTVPVLIVHGKNDGVIPTASSALLKPALKKTDRYILLANTNHNNIQNSTDFQLEATRFIEK